MMRTAVLTWALLVALALPSVPKAGSAIIRLDPSPDVSAGGSLEPSGRDSARTPGSIALELGPSQGGEIPVTVPVGGISLSSMDVTDPRVRTLVRAGIRLTSPAQGSISAETQGSRILSVQGRAAGRVVEGEPERQFDLVISAVLPAAGDESQQTQVWIEGWDPRGVGEDAKPCFVMVIPGALEEE